MTTGGARSSAAETPVLCVEDNTHVADALRQKLSRTAGFSWSGWLPTADELVEHAEKGCPGVVLLDLDMPGRNPFDALAELTTRCPDVKVVIFSGHVRRELIERAIEAGVWGYASKSDGEGALIDVMRSVVAGDFALSPAAQSAWGS